MAEKPKKDAIVQLSDEQVAKFKDDILAEKKAISDAIALLQSASNELGEVYASIANANKREVTDRITDTVSKWGVHLEAAEEHFVQAEEFVSAAAEIVSKVNATPVKFGK